MCMGLGCPPLFLPFFSGMQSFFVATEQFSVQNVRMQEQNAESKVGLLKKIGLMNLICLTMFAGMVLVVLAAVAYTYRKVPTAHWRESGDKLPLRAVELSIEDFKARWNNAKGNARLELRTNYYPSATITLGNGNGSGMLMVKFVDKRYEQHGAVIAIPYKDGQFVPQNDFNLKAEGKTAEVLLEYGYKDTNEYRLHQLTEEEPLWRAQLFQRPAGAQQTYYLGYTTISPIAE